MLKNICLIWIVLVPSLWSQDSNTPSLDSLLEQIKTIEEYLNKDPNILALKRIKQRATSLAQTIDRLEKSVAVTAHNTTAILRKCHRLVMKQHLQSIFEKIEKEKYSVWEYVQRSSQSSIKKLYQVVHQVENMELSYLDEVEELKFRMHELKRSGDREQPEILPIQKHLYQRTVEATKFIPIIRTEGNKVEVYPNDLLDVGQSVFFYWGEKKVGVGHVTYIREQKTLITIEMKSLQVPISLLNGVRVIKVSYHKN